MNDMKEFEELRWECLIRSKKFLDLWAYYRTEMHKIESTSVKISCKTNKDLQEKLNKMSYMVNAFTKRTTERFGNLAVEAARYVDYLPSHTPEETDFEMVWQACFANNKQLKYRQPYVFSGQIASLIPVMPPPVIDFGERTLFCIDMIIKVFRELNNRDPNIDELKEYLRQWMEETYSSPCTFLMITQLKRTPQETEELLKEVSCILKQKERPPKMTRLRINECKRYLRVFSLIEAGKTPQEISTEVWPNQKPKDKGFENIRTYINKDYKKAKEIIYRAETGQL